jgi:hypothetical protein
VVDFFGGQLQPYHFVYWFWLGDNLLIITPTISSIPHTVITSINNNNNKNKNENKNVVGWGEIQPLSSKQCK